MTPESRARALALFDHERRHPVTRDGRPIVTSPPLVRIGPPDRAFHTIIHSSFDVGVADEVVERTVAHYDSIGAEFEWKVYAHDAPADLRDRLARRGFLVGPMEVVLVYELSEAARPACEPPRDARVERVDSPSRLADFRDVVDGVFGASSELMTDEIVQSLGSAASRDRAYVVYAGDVPVSAGRLSARHRGACSVDCSAEPRARPIAGAATIGRWSTSECKPRSSSGCATWWWMRYRPAGPRWSVSDLSPWLRRGPANGDLAHARRTSDAASRAPTEGDIAEAGRGPGGVLLIRSAPAWNCSYIGLRDEGSYEEADAMVAPFHLSFCVADLERTRAFYAGVLGCREGHSSPTHIDFAFYGSQLTCHWAPERVRPASATGLDGNHFGAILTPEEFTRLEQRLRAAQVTFIASHKRSIEGHRANVGR